MSEKTVSTNFADFTDAVSVKSARSVDDRHAGGARVAVIAVHGVADQAPHASAEAIAEMLARAGVAKGVTYTPFVDEPVHLYLQPAGVPPDVDDVAHVTDVTDAEHRRSALARLFDERSAYVSAARARAHARRRRRAEPDLDGHHGTFAIEFMKSQLAGYVSRGEAYETKRFVSTRATTDGPPTTVHVYEAYWADLSRLRNGALRFLGELYQLLFHLSNLGQQALDFTYLENRGFLWRWCSRTYVWAARALTLPIALLNLVALVAALAVVPAAVVPNALERDVVCTVAGLAGVAAGAWALWRRSVRGNDARGTPDAARRAPSTWAWYLAPPVGAAVAIGLVLLAASGPLGTGGALAIEWWAICAVPVAVLLASYEGIRPGAKLVGGVAYAAGMIAFTALAWHFGKDAAPTHRGAPLEYASLWTFRLLFSVIGLCMIALVLSAIVSAATGVLAVQAMPRRTPPDRRRRARAADACTTARLAISLPLVGFLSVTLMIWTALYALASQHSAMYRDIDTSQLDAPAAVRPVLDALTPGPAMSIALMDPCTWTAASRVRVALREHAGSCATLPPRDAALTYLHGLLMQKAGSGFIITLALLGACLVIYVTVNGPSLVAEMVQGRDPPFEKMDDGARSAANGSSRTYGAWIDRGRAGIPALVWLLWTAAFVVPIVFLTLYAVVATSDNALAFRTLDWLGPKTRLVLDAGGGVLVSSGVLAIGIVFFTDFLSGATAALDVMLDVDNYMREGPRDRTPRARIAERYTSLLRYIASWRDAQGNGYTDVVFVAHSLGTVITVELLRHLRASVDAVQPSPLDAMGLEYAPEHTAELTAEYATHVDASSAPIKLHLVTMGSPLRQLFGQFFPHLYGWTRADDEDRRSTLPSAAVLGVRHWVNAYRSGDYVGRALWAAPSGPVVYDRAGGPAAVDAEGRAEWCVGGGAHTHYWDDTSPEVGVVVDSLVAGVLSPRV